MSERKFPQAVALLEKGLERYHGSEGLWLLYLQLKAQLSSVGTLAEELLSRAVASSQSYAVIFQVGKMVTLSARPRRQCHGIDTNS